MSSVVVSGGGVIGLAAAVLLARDGHAVTVLEQDAEPPPAGPDGAWSSWQRRGVPQFRQPHNLFPRFQAVLDADLPDVSSRLLERGCRWRDPTAQLPPSLPDRAPRPGDERFRFLTGRRPVVEAAFAAAAEAEPGVTVRRGVRTTGLLLDAGSTPPRVLGVRTDEGAEHRSDLVVDAMGRSSPVAGWLAAHGAAAEVTSQDRGFAYYTRYFHGALPAPRAPGLSPLGSISLLTIPGDGDTWSVTVFGTSRDKVLKAVREPDRFAAVVGACPLHAHWLDGDPITDVLPMAGVIDRYRRFVVDGRPIVTGLLAVGDAWACTNPSAGRGLSVGLLHAQALRDVVREHPVVDADLALAWDAATEEVVAPWFWSQERSDRARVAEMEAVRDGRDVPPPDPAMRALQAAAVHDADAFRAVLEIMMCLALPQQALARPAVAAAVTAVGDASAPPLPGPSRSELVELLTR